MTNEASSMGCLYYLINHHVLCTTYTLCNEIMGVKEKVSTEFLENWERRETKRKMEDGKKIG